VEHDLIRPGRRPETDGLRDRAGVPRDGGSAGPPHRLQPPRRVRAGHRQQVEDDRMRAGAADVGPGLVNDLPGGAHLLDGAARVQDGAVGELASDPEGTRAGRRAEDRRRGQRRPVERHVVQLHVAAVHRHPLAVKQPAQRRKVLAEQGQRGIHPGADLAHPGLHAVPDADRDPAGEHAVQRGDLHRRQRHVAQRDRGHPDRHRQPLGPPEQRRRDGHRPAPEAVLPEPQFGQPRFLGHMGHFAQPLRWNLGPAGGRENRHDPILPEAGQPSACLGATRAQAAGELGRADGDRERAFDG